MSTTQDRHAHFVMAVALTSLGSFNLLFCFWHLASANASSLSLAFNFACAVFLAVLATIRWCRYSGVVS